MSEKGEIKVKATILSTGKAEPEVELQTITENCSPAEVLDVLALAAARNIVNIADANPLSKQGAKIGKLISLTSTTALFTTALQKHLEGLTHEYFDKGTCNCSACKCEKSQTKDTVQ